MWTTTCSNSEMNGGGYIQDILSVNSKKTINMTRLCMDCIASRNFSFLNFLLSYNFTPDLSYTDVQGNNILHGLVVAAKQSENSSKALYQILHNMPCKDALNHQNVNGDTPLHFATLEGQHELVALFISKGAKRTQNNSGLLVMTEVEPNPEVRCNKQEIFVPSRNKILKPKRVQKELSDSTEKLLSALVSYFPNAHENRESAMSFSATSEPNKLQKKENVEASVMSFSATSENPKMLKLSGGCGCNNKPSDAKIIGGKKLNKITGHRKMTTYSELEYGNILGESSSDANTTSELTQNFRKQTDKFHEETVAKIMQLLGSKADIVLAKAIKAILYNEVKTSRQELNGFDRAVEMLHRVTDKKIEEIMKHQSDLLNDIMSHLKSRGSSESDKPRKAKKVESAEKTKPKAKSKTQSKEEKKAKPKKAKKMSRHIVSSASELSSVSLDSFM